MCGFGCGNENIIWILLLLCCCGNNDGCGSWGDSSSWLWILILLCCCGNTAAQAAEKAEEDKIKIKTQNPRSSLLQSRRKNTAEPAPSERAPKIFDKPLLTFNR